MSTSSPHPGPDHKLPSLLEEPAPPPAVPSAPPTPPTPPTPPAPSASRAAVARVGEWVRSHRALSFALAGVAAIGMGVGAYFALRPVPQPDFLDDDLDLVLDYAWLTDDFNHLPVQQRRELMADMIERLKNMPSGDSALMAMFAAKLDEKARKQMMVNVSHMAIDTWDEYAKKYDGVPAEERSDYLDKTFVEFTKMMESMAGEPSNKTDEQRLAEVKRQAERDRKNVETGKFNPPAQALGRAFEIMNFEVGGNASPQQRTRGQLMMRDMMRHFRGEDVNGTSKPGKAPGAKGDKPADPPQGPK